MSLDIRPKGFIVSPSPPDPADHDPMAVPSWSFVMTAAWVATRNIETLRWQMPEWRVAHAIPATATLSMARQDDDGLPHHPMFFAVDLAVKTLRNAGIEGRIVAKGLVEGRTVAKGRVLVKKGQKLRKMKSADWQYADEQTASDQLDDCWRTKTRRVFREITFSRDEVLKAWPPVENVPSAERDEAPASSPRRQRALSLEVRAAIAWAQAKNGGRSPDDISDAQVAAAVRRWLSTPDGKTWVEENGCVGVLSAVTIQRNRQKIAKVLGG